MESIQYGIERTQYGTGTYILENTLGREERCKIGSERKKIRKNMFALICMKYHFY